MVRKLAWKPGKLDEAETESLSNNLRLVEYSRTQQKYIKINTLKMQLVNISIKDTSILISAKFITVKCQNKSSRDFTLIV